MKSKIIFTILCLFITINSFAGDEKGSLTIRVNNIQVKSGTIHLALYNQAEDFLTEKTYLATIEAVNDSEELVIVLNDLPFGEYAISLYHDENDNKELDKYMGLIPKEAYGFSNNARGSMGPPSYDQSKFIFNENEMEISIRVE